jgi:hypothetical protein
MLYTMYFVFEIVIYVSFLTYSANALLPLHVIYSVFHNSLWDFRGL